MIKIKNRYTNDVFLTVDAENLYGANLYGANLSGANLRGADLHDADLRSADLRDADLRDADLCGADLREALTFYAENRHWYEGMATFGGNPQLREWGEIAAKALSTTSQEVQND